MPTSTQRAVGTAAGVTVVLFLFAVVMVLSTPPDGGANIGAGMVLLLVLAASFVTAVLLLGTGRRGAVLVVASSAVSWLAYLSLAVDDTGPRWLGLALVAVAVLAPVVWIASTLAGDRRRH